MRIVKIQDTVLKYRYPKYGITKVMKGIENIVMSQFYVSWKNLDETTRKEFLQKIRKLIRRELLGKDLLRAIAKDLIKQEIKLDSNVTRLIKTKYYKGDLKALLADFQSILNDEEAEKRKEKYGRRE